MNKAISRVGPGHLNTLKKLQKLGFEFVQYERFPSHLAAKKNKFVVLLEANANGWEIFGQAGYQFSDGIGMLVSDKKRKFFKFHKRIIWADKALLSQFDKFKREIRDLLKPVPSKKQPEKGHA